MMPAFLIIVIIIVFGLSIGYSISMMRKQKLVSAKYETDEALARAPQIMDELTTQHFAALKKQMSGSPIHGFTQCAYITTVKSKLKSAAVTAAKTVAWAAVGVKARYSENDHISYLVLSGNELHYLFFEEGEVKEHLVFDRYRLLNARSAAINNAEKVTRLGSIAGQKPFKITIDIDGETTDLFFYGEIRRMPDSVMLPFKGRHELLAKFKLMGRYFQEQLYNEYPHLSA